MWILQDLELGLYLYKMESQMHMLQSYLHIQGVSQEGKKSCNLHKLGNKMQLGVWGAL